MQIRRRRLNKFIHPKYFTLKYLKMSTGQITLKDEAGQVLTSVTVNLDKNRRFTGSELYQGIAEFFDLPSDDFTLSGYDEDGSYINDSTLYKFKSGMSVQAFDEPISKMIKTVVINNEYGPELRYKVYPDLSDWSELAIKIERSVGGKVLYVTDGFGKNHPADSRFRISSREIESGKFSFIADVEDESSDDDFDESDEKEALRQENDLLRSELEKVRLELEEAKKELAVMRRREPRWDSSDSGESPSPKRRFPVKPPAPKPVYSDSDSDEEPIPLRRPMTIAR